MAIEIQDARNQVLALTIRQVGPIQIPKGKELVNKFTSTLQARKQQEQMDAKVEQVRTEAEKNDMDMGGQMVYKSVRRITTKRAPEQVELTSFFGPVKVQKSDVGFSVPYNAKLRG